MSRVNTLLKFRLVETDETGGEHVFVGRADAALQTCFCLVQLLGEPDAAAKGDQSRRYLVSRFAVVRTSSMSP
jgi:hypothetical protein